MERAVIAVAGDADRVLAAALADLGPVLADFAEACSWLVASCNGSGSSCAPSRA